jgi:hypothetical protein
MDSAFIGTTDMTTLFPSLIVLSFLSSAYADDRVAALQSLDRDLQASIRSLKSDITVFHYRFKNEASGQDDLAALKRTADRFQSAPYNGEAFGDGLYAAANPFISAHYGGASGLTGGNRSVDWKLAVITLKAGTKVLDLHQESKDLLTGNYVQLSSETLTLLAKAYSCRVKEARARFSTIFFSPPACLEVLKDFIRTREISAIIYDWGQSQIEGCADHSAATVIYDGKILDASTVEVFTAESATRSPTQRFLFTAARENRGIVFAFYTQSKFMLRAWEKLGLVPEHRNPAYRAWRDSMLYCR